MKKIIYIDNFLTQSGHTPTTGTTLVKQFKEAGYKVIFSSKQKNKILRLLDMLFTIVANGRNAVVLIGTYSQSAFYFAVMCAGVCRLLHIHYIPCLHGGNLPTRIKRSPVLSDFYFGNSFMNVAVSGYLGSLMVNNHWKCVEIPNNIPVQNYQFGHRTAAAPSLFWARSFHTNYNPALAVQVLFQLKKKYPGATLTMAGPDKDDNSLEICKALVQQLGVQNSVHFPGLLTQKEWTDLSASSDIFINTSIVDNLPVSVIEAMALGMIIITTDVGGIPFLVEDGKNGILVSSGDQKAFVAAIENVITNPDKAGALSLAAHKQAQIFDWKNIKMQWDKLFSEASAVCFMLIFPISIFP